MSRFTSEQIDDMCDLAKSYANGVEQAMAKYDLDLDELEELLLDRNVEKCEGCDWFFDSFDLVDDEDDEPSCCPDCRSS